MLLFSIRLRKNNYFQDCNWTRGVLFKLINNDLDRSEVYNGRLVPCHGLAVNGLILNVCI